MLACVTGCSWKGTEVLSSLVPVVLSFDCALEPPERALTNVETRPLMGFQMSSVWGVTLS